MGKDQNLSFDQHMAKKNRQRKMESEGSAPPPSLPPQPPRDGREPPPSDTPNPGDLRKKFTAMSHEVYVIDDIPVKLRRSDADNFSEWDDRQYSHSISKHGPWNTTDHDRHDTTKSMFEVKQQFINENIEQFREAKRIGDISNKVKSVSANLMYNNKK